MPAEKALRLSQLTLKGNLTPTQSAHAVSVTPPISPPIKSAHEVFSAFWIDPTNSQTIEGFFKRVTTSEDTEDNYPILLAKYNVAISVMMRIWLGEIAAEDRLVFNDEGQIVGTFSRNLPDYKPLSSLEKPCSTDELEPELVYPKSVVTLLQQKVARILMAQWAIGNPDLHPYNISIKGEGSVLDYDECLPRRTLIMKEGRGVLSQLEAMLVNKPQKLVGEDLNTFPILAPGNERKHWPTNRIPGNLNLSKQFQSYETFVQLAAVSHIPIKLASGEEVSFQEQMFESLLQMLITSDKDMLRARLYDYLGDLTLDFMSLPESKREALRASDSQLFNDTTDKQSFVDHMLKEFQQQYDELYRAVVFYQGFKPQVTSLAAPVVSFVDFLRNRPSAQKKILEWALSQNILLSVETRYDAEKMEDRYAQIWRDAHLIQFLSIWHNLKALVLNIANELKISPRFVSPDPSFKIDDNITETGQVIKSLTGLLRSLDVSVDSEAESNLTQGLRALISFLDDLTKASQDYFDSTAKTLTAQANDVYCDALLMLPQKYKIILKQFKSTTWESLFATQVRDLNIFYGSLRLDLHKSSRDEALTAPIKIDYTELLDRPHTDKEVVDTFIKAFFEWANTGEKSNLIGHIDAVRKQYDEPLYTTNVFSLFSKGAEFKVQNPLTSRYRGPEVAAYLKDIETRDEVDGANILAHILSTGQCEATSLNTRIIASILPLVLRWKRGFGGIDCINLMSLDKAQSGGTVNYLFYTTQIVQYVKTSGKFENNIYSHLSQRLFNGAMYVWVNTIERRRLEALINRAILEYDPASKPDASYATWLYGCVSAKMRSAVGTTSRAPLVRAYLDSDLSNAGVLGSIFKEGGLVEPTVVAGVPMTNRPLNLCLFDRVFAAMKEDFADPTNWMRNNPDFDIIGKIDKAKSKHYHQEGGLFFRFYAKQYSTEIITRVESQASTNSQVSP